MQEKPDWLPAEIYTEAMVAKRFYNAQWEFWVWLVSCEHNCSQAKAEDACIRGIKKELAKIKFVYGDLIGRWYEEFLEMGDIFDKVKHPVYTKKLEGV
jgi:hypothetical protein